MICGVQVSLADRIASASQVDSQSNSRTCGSANAESVWTQRPQAARRVQMRSGHRMAQLRPDEHDALERAGLELSQES